MSRSHSPARRQTTSRQSSTSACTELDSPTRTWPINRPKRKRPQIVREQGHWKRSSSQLDFLWTCNFLFGASTKQKLCSVANIVSLSINWIIFFSSFNNRLELDIQLWTRIHKHKPWMANCISYHLQVISHGHLQASAWEPRLSWRILDSMMKCLINQAYIHIQLCTALYSIDGTWWNLFIFSSWYLLLLLSSGSH